MKTSTLFKSIATLFVGLIIGTGAFAQTSLLYVNDAEADSAVVGARMPYYVAPDGVVASMVTAGLLSPSYYKWVLSDGGTPVKYDGTAATQHGTMTAYYAENEISHTWATTGAKTVSVVERSNPLSGLADGCEQVAAVTRNVEVVPVPTIDYTTAGGFIGACNTTTLNVPITLSGTGPWLVSYTVTAPNGTDVSTITDQVVGIVKPYTASITTLPLVIDFTEGALTGVAGVYKVRITKVVDRLTAKALNTVEGTIATAGDYNVGILATPTTSPIQHVRNL